MIPRWQEPVVSKRGPRGIYGEIDIERIMTAHYERERRAWKIRCDNAMRCYKVHKTLEGKQEVVQFYKEEFRRLGWRVRDK